MWENGLIKNLWLVSKYLTSHVEQEIITIHLLLNISRNKGNQIVNFRQLVKYNVKNIFPEKSYTKCGVKASLRLFDKKSSLALSLDE